MYWNYTSIRQISSVNLLNVPNNHTVMHLKICYCVINYKLINIEINLKVLLLGVFVFSKHPFHTMKYYEKISVVFA